MTTDPANLPTTYSPKEVAGLLGVSPRTVLNWSCNGRLGPVVRINPRVIRIPEDAVARCLSRAELAARSDQLRPSGGTKVNRKAV